MLVNIKNFVEEYDDEEVFYDERFQRRVVWDQDTTSVFVTSVTRGWARLSTIVFADVRACFKYAKKMKCRASMTYFQNLLKKGYRWVSLDGQNRSKKMIEFMNNGFPVTAALYDQDDLITTIVNDYFKDMPQRVQDRINSEFLEVKIAPPCLVNELPEVFEALNSGDPLWDHEKRNAYFSPIAGWVRKTRKALDDAMKRVVSEKSAIRMLDDELVAKMAMVLIKNNPDRKTGEWGLSISDLNKFYKMGLGFDEFIDEGCPYTKSDIDRVEEILTMWNGCITQQKYYAPSQMVARKMSWAILYACEWAYDNDYYVDSDSYANFFAEMKNIDAMLDTDSLAAYSTERTNAMQNGEDPDEIKKGGYYFSWTGLPQKPEARRQRSAALIAEISKSPRKLGLRKMMAA